MLKWRELEETNQLKDRGKRVRVHDVQLAIHFWPLTLRWLPWLIWRTSLGLPIAAVLQEHGFVDPHTHILVLCEVIGARPAEVNRE